MMRLIDADLLIKGRVENDPVVIAAKCTPTAYDPDKVEEQLDTYITKLVGRNSALYQTVMQIVKGGGVDGN